MNNRLIRFLRDRRAATAVEMALMIPILMIVFAGFYESYLYVRSVSTLERTAFTISDLISRRNLVCNASSTSDPNSLNTYLSTVAPMLAQPLDLKDNGELIVSAVITSKSQGTIVSWQKVSPYALSGVSSQIGKAGGAAKLAGGIVPASDGDTVIVTEIFYNYDWFSLLRKFIPGMPPQATLTRTAYFRARVNSLSVLYTSSINANCPP